MTDGRSLTTISAADYEAIESAVMETERGRWFLKEFARRNRMADTKVLLEAIGRLEKAVAGERVAQDIDRLRSNLKDMATAISRTKSEIASIHAVEQEHSHLFAASEALDGITRTTEQATSDILAAAEQIQEAAWTLREDGANPDLCDDLDRRATEIYTACSFQDITAQRIAKIIQTLRYLEGRINAMIAVWECGAVDAHLEEVVATFDHGVRDDVGSLDLTQGDIDCVIVEGDFFATEPGEAAEPNEAPRSECKSDGPELPFSDEIPPRAFATTTSAENTASRSLQASTEVIDVEAFTDIDQLPTRERLRLFT
jgi:chemotaxis regulatin CheY-phosphate phosphatase CheZ